MCTRGAGHRRGNRCGGKIADSSGSAFGIQVSIGSSQTQAKSQSSQETQRGTNLQAKDIELVAREGDLTATGAKIQADNNIDLEAAGNIVLTAARDSQSQTSSQTGSSASLGVTFGLGQQSNCCS